MFVLKVMTLAVATTVTLCSLAYGQDGAPPREQATKRAQQLGQYFADTLMLTNHREISLSQLAEERTTTPEVKQLAQTIIEDHSKLNSELEELMPGASKRFERASQPSDAAQLARHGILTRLCMINHQAAENHLDRSREMLQQYKGQDFDMAFLGLQIATHNWLLAELQAIDDVGSSQFNDLVHKTTQSVEGHLKKAIALSRQLEDDRRTARAPVR